MPLRSLRKRLKESLALRNPARGARRIFLIYGSFPRIRFPNGSSTGQKPYPVERFEAFAYGKKTDPIACRIAIRDDYSGQVQHFCINLQYTDIFIPRPKFTQHWIMSIKI